MPPLLTADAFAEKNPKVRTTHAKEIMIGAVKASKFAGLMGTGDDAIIKTENKNASEATICTMSFLAPLRTRGSRGNEALDNTENKLKRMFMDILGNVLAENVLSENKKLLSRSSWATFRKDAKSSLKDWLRWLMDAERFAKLSRDCTKITVVKADGTVSETPADLALGDTLGALAVDEAYNRAKNGFTDAIGKRHAKMKPYKVEVGKVKGVSIEIELFVLFLGGKSASSLTNDPLFLEKKTALADIDRAKMPFAGGIGIYDEKVIIVDVGTWNEEDTGVVTSATADWIDINDQTIGGFSQYAGAGGIETEVNLMLGAGAGIQPFQAVPDYEEDGKTIDSGRKLKIFIDTFFGFEKFRPQGKTVDEKALVWHDADYGVQALVASVK